MKLIISLLLIIPSLSWGLTFVNGKAIKTEVDVGNENLNFFGTFLKPMISIPFKSEEGSNKIFQRFKKNGFPVLDGSSSIEFDVNRFDYGCASAQDKPGPFFKGKFDYCDEKYGRSRQEISLHSKRNFGLNGEYVVEWAMFLPKDFKTLTYGAAHFFQIGSNLKECSDFSSDEPPGWLSTFTNPSNGKRMLMFSYGHSGVRKNIDMIDNLKGKWTKFKFHISNKFDNTGFLKFYVNGNQIVNEKNIQTLKNKCEVTFIKFGIYRHAHQYAYLAGKFDKVPDQKIYIDSIKVYKP